VWYRTREELSGRGCPPKGPLERAGINPRANVVTASAGRSAPIRSADRGEAKEWEPPELSVNSRGPELAIVMRLTE
jgi:hypothetical protein